MHILFIILICCLPVMAHAQVPVPQSKREAIGNLDERIEQYKKDEKRLKEEAQKVEGDLESTKDKLVDIAHSVQSNESTLQKLEQQMALLERQRTDMQESLDDDRKSIGKLIIALQRIRRVPTEAMIARPNAPIDTARSAMLMGDILPAITRQSEALKVKLEELAALNEELQAKQQEANKRSDVLKSEQEKLEKLIQEREDLFAKINKDLKVRQSEIAQVSQQAKNLDDLVKRLDQERTRNAAKAQKSTKKPVSYASLPKVGDTQLPLKGFIQTRFNEEDSFGANSQGLVIEGRAGALIVAPMGGVIRFAGYFKNYGNMVILEHKNGYHSLIAGLEKVDTVVDQSVGAGEPLGKLYSSSSGKNPTLYYELRHNGKAVDPAAVFGNLG